MDAPAAPATATLRIASPGEPYPFSRSTETGMSTSVVSRATWFTSSASDVPPSARPRVNAKPELVVASAGKPSDSSTRAEPTSHGFGIRNGAPECSALNRSACDDTQHVLPVPLELCRPDAGDERELGERRRAPF